MATWSGTSILVTGAGKRVGRAIALAFGSAGAKVVVHYRSSGDEAEAVVDELRASGSTGSLSVQADLANANEVAALADAVGGIDVLVNNAASFASADFFAGPDADWERAWAVSLSTNLVAPARLVRAFAPALRQRQGAVVNIHDIAAETVWPGHVAHGCAKAGLVHLTRCLAAELAPDVRVNGVMPSIAVFPPDMPEDERQRQIDETLLGRPGTPEDIADTVLFVAGHRYMTGAHIPVDGGWAVHRHRSP